MLVALGVALGVGALSSVRVIHDLELRRDRALQRESDVASIGGSMAAAFRRMRLELAAGERFALVFDPRTSADHRNTYDLLARSYLYPAIATSDPDDADAVMVFGRPPPAVRRAFDEVGVVTGVWLGRRPR